MSELFALINRRRLVRNIAVAIVAQLVAEVIKVRRENGLT